MAPSSNSIRLLAQRLYPMAQQAYERWERMPQSEKDRVVEDAKRRAGKFVKSVAERSKARTTPTTPAPTGAQPTPPADEPTKP